MCANLCIFSEHLFPRTPLKDCFCKYFIGYLYNDHKAKALHIMLPKSTNYVKRYDGQTKWMYLLVEDNDLLENIVLVGIKLLLIRIW